MARKNNSVTGDTLFHSKYINYLHLFTLFSIINIKGKGLKFMNKNNVQLTALLVFMSLFVMFEAYAGKREKVIAFDDDLVEGMNKRPLDSLQQLGSANKNRRSHLYRKRGSYPTETKITLQEMGWM